MHTLTLVTVELPEIEADSKTDLNIEKEIERLTTESKKKPDNIMLSFSIEQLNSLKTAFARAISSALSDKMDYYAQEPENSDYLEFEDYTEEIKEDYKNKSVECIKFPDGRIIPAHHEAVREKYEIIEGKVYEKSDNSDTKYTKPAKDMILLPNVPYKEIYKTFKEFAEKESYYDYNEEHDGYGYMFNPNAFWDWYSIGGRWPKLFLVKENCTEVSMGTRTCDTGDEQFKAPEGYKWVCAARKKDIQWQTMSEWKKNKASEDFKMFEQWFKDGKCPEDAYVSITDNSIETFGSKLYIKGETLDENLSRLGIVSKHKYPNLAHAYLADDGYNSADSIWRPDADDSVITETWRTMLDNYIDSIPDDTVIVGVDCHM